MLANISVRVKACQYFFGGMLANYFRELVAGLPILLIKLYILADSIAINYVRAHLQ